MDCSPPDFSIHGNSQARNTWVGCHVLHQAIFPTQEPPTQRFNSQLLSLLHWQADSLPLSSHIFHLLVNLFLNFCMHPYLWVLLSSPLFLKSPHHFFSTYISQELSSCIVRLLMIASHLLCCWAYLEPIPQFYIFVLTSEQVSLRLEPFLKVRPTFQVCYWLPITNWAINMSLLFSMETVFLTKVEGS